MPARAVVTVTAECNLCGKSESRTGASRAVAAAKLTEAGWTVRMRRDPKFSYCRCPDCRWKWRGGGEAWRNPASKINRNHRGKQ